MFDKISRSSFSQKVKETKPPMKTTHFLLSVILWLPALRVAAEETLIYQHAFGGSPDAALDASPVDSARDSADWVHAHPSIHADGKFAAKTGPRNAYLPFIPEPGHIYTYTVKLEINDPLADGSKESQDWVAIGFGDKPSRSIFVLSSTCSLLLRRNGEGLIHFRSDPSGEDGEKKDHQKVARGATIATLGIVLDTSGKEWTVLFQIDGEEMGSRTFATAPDIQFLGIGQLGAVGGKISELKLTQKSP